MRVLQRGGCEARTSHCQHTSAGLAEDMNNKRAADTHVMQLDDESRHTGHTPSSASSSSRCVSRKSARTAVDLSVSSGHADKGKHDYRDLIDRVPTVHWILIFDYFDLMQVMQCSSVCKVWHAASRDRQLLHTLHAMLLQHMKDNLDAYRYSFETDSQLDHLIIDGNVVTPWRLHYEVAWRFAANSPALTSVLQGAHNSIYAPLIPVGWFADNSWGSVDDIDISSHFSCVKLHVAARTFVDDDGPATGQINSTTHKLYEVAINKAFNGLWAHTLTDLLLLWNVCPDNYSAHVSRPVHSFLCCALYAAHALINLRRLELEFLSQQPDLSFMNTAGYQLPHLEKLHVQAGYRFEPHIMEFIRRCASLRILRVKAVASSEEQLNEEAEEDEVLPEFPPDYHHRGLSRSRLTVLTTPPIATQLHCISLSCTRSYYDDSDSGLEALCWQHLQLYPALTKLPDHMRPIRPCQLARVHHWSQLTQLSFGCRVSEEAITALNALTQLTHLTLLYSSELLSHVRASRGFTVPVQIDESLRVPLTPRPGHSAVSHTPAEWDANDDETKLRGTFTESMLMDLPSFERLFHPDNAFLSRLTTLCLGSWVGIFDIDLMQLLGCTGLLQLEAEHCRFINSSSNVTAFSEAVQRGWTRLEHIKMEKCLMPVDILDWLQSPVAALRMVMPQLQSCTIRE